MSAGTQVQRDPRSVVQATYSFTFGHHMLKEPWDDVRALAWPELASLLTTHTVGRKEGSCIVPAVFSGTRRKKAEAVRIEVAFLDSDTGVPIDEIRAAIARQGWAAIISSTHSHLTTRIAVKRNEWERYCRENGHQASPEQFLRKIKGYLPRIAAGARQAGEVGEYVLLEHAPCPKFRIAIPLLRPWQAADYKDWRAGAAVWKGRVEALAVALGLHHDQACTDTSRLFYLPRRAANGPDAETAILEGEPCDIFCLPDAASLSSLGTGIGRKRTRARHVGDDDARNHVDPETGKVVDLRAWARHYGSRFLIEKALRARRPAAFIGKLADAVKHHIRCPNEAEHTQAGADEATFIVNAGATAEAKGFVIHCRHAHCDGRDRLFFLRHMLQQGWLSTADLTNPEFLAGSNASPRPVIHFVAGEIPQVVDQAEAALISADLGLFQRGSYIVRPGRVLVTVASGREVQAQRAIEVGEHALAEVMTAAADWKRFDGRKGDWVPIDVPSKIARTYKERVGRWKLPVLTGIITAPTLRPDGSLIATPGYDVASGLLLDPCGVAFPAIPARPSRDDAAEALGILLKLVETFPFVSEADRSVALSAILTACIRRSLPTAPLHGFTAPAAGSGKSMLVDLTSLIATGREAGVIAQGKREEEFEKRLGALLLAGEQVIAIDNCEQPLGGEFLCQMLTQQIVRARILGRSEAPELPSNAFVTATGNNLALMGDMTRRGILCRLDAKHERPELRRFDVDPATEIKDNRGRYIAAALTILRAYHVVGRPKQAEPLGSFEEWSNWVRGALLWLGQADPIETMEDARCNDPQLETLTAVLTQWAEVIGSQRISSREIIERATAQRTPAASFAPIGRLEFVSPDFREALLGVAGDGGVVNGRRLSKWISVHEGRIARGMKIVSCGMLRGFMTWRLEISK